MRARGFHLSLWLLVLCIPVAIGSQSHTNAPQVIANANRTPAGTLTGGVLELKLEITTALWHPEAENGPGLLIRVLSEEGKAPTNPAPLIRVPEGTEIHVSVRNRLKLKAMVGGLRTRPSTKNDFEVPPSETREVRFLAGAPGTYVYYAETPDDPATRTADSQMAGAFIVDPANEPPNDRLFVVSLFEVPQDPFHAAMGTLLVNGKSWPYTEHLTYRVGEHARWRWINLSTLLHPMHLHGAYFNVTGVGNLERDVRYGEGDTRSVVTEQLERDGSFRVDWVPERTGRWIFHCHLAPHFTGDNQLPRVMYPEAWGPAYASRTPAPDARASHDSHDDLSTAGAGMAGLVVGITVVPGDAPAAAPPPARVTSPARKLELVAASRTPGSGNHATMGYTVREGGRTLPTTGTMVSPTIVLTQNQPVEVTISNRLTTPTAVHWHGIELASYYDGVPGWGGEGRQVTPSIAPGGSFVARFTPPRAGTFIYHTHWHDPLQLVSGLYGPLIIMPPGQTFDPETDKVVLISIDGMNLPGYPYLVNGTTSPEPMNLRVGTRYRFRLINLTDDDPDMQVSLREGEAAVSWRAIAKDGADLPESQRRLVETKNLTVSVGETYDFEFVPDHAGRLALDVHRPPFKHVITVVTVK